MRNESIADREPCPWRIVDDVGGAFSMGAVGGGVYHIIKGSLNAPINSRLIGSMNAMTARGPVLGGQFAVWGGLFACCDCSLTALRQKEDPWNSIMSGAATGGILAARAGPKAMTSAAVVGGVLLALIEGAGIMVTKYMSPALQSPEEMAAAGMMDPTAPPTASGMALNSGPTAPPSAPPTDDGSSSSGGGGADPFDVLAGGGRRSSTDFDSFPNATQFSTESSGSSEDNSNSSSGGWWPFGGKS
mmetsp:Transcript_10454/g.12286  ORF Transcript_10454/g.12286 Transcript_10454/m.12286 type:complete len:245 (-) Transcript_10454:43-777(-)